MSNQDDKKRRVAERALEYVKQVDVLGVGTGSTVNFFIELLKDCRSDFSAVSSSAATTERLKQLGVEVLSLNEVRRVDVYIDGADEVDPHFSLIKGGGGAMTQEKIVASAADKFVVMVDDSKCVDRLNHAFPVPVEVLPMARSLAARTLVEMGGNPVYRQGVVTDNGNVILDVYDLPVEKAWADWEREINLIPGVVENGLFATLKPTTVLVSWDDHVEVRHRD